MSDSISRRKRAQKKRFLLFFPAFFRHPRKNAKKVAFSVALFLIGIALLCWIVLYFLFLHDAPSIDDIQTSFKESSVIYDREGNPLYTIYGGSENRKYVSYDQISKNIVHAVVAMEDQTFFTNPGFDVFGIARSAFDCVTNRTGLCGGGSTLSQQLIKNTLLSPERTIKRKVQEVWLSWQLNSRFEKEKILELYLNKISFGSNSDGVEQASKRFFDTSASEVNILEAAILASLPQAPTTYNPYRGRDLLMGYVYSFGEDNPDEVVRVRSTTEDPFYLDAYTKMMTYLGGLTYESKGDNVTVCGITSNSLKNVYTPKGEGCVGLAKKDLMDFWNAIQLKHETGLVPLPEEGTADGEESNAAHFIEYQAGRKDRVLMRMFEDGYITGPQLGEAFIEGLDYVFESSRESIIHPHFVFYVREYIEQTYGEEFFAQGGWKIYTTVDPELQTKAEELVTKQAELNAVKFGTNNSALITLDNENGEVLAMVGSKDFYDEEIDGQVNITTSLKQPGSSFKPLIFARGFEHNAISPATPFFDVPTAFGSYEPENYDGEFLGPMTVGSSLAHSRNTTAVKMYYLATQHNSSDIEGEYDLVEYLRNLGLVSIEHRDPKYMFGASIALGTAEVKPIEFAEVYSSFANAGIYQPAIPILKIIDRDGNEIVPVTSKRQSLLPGAAYLITNILSDPTLRPEYWSTFLSVKGHPAASKTGTSNKRFGERILPRDLWTVGYTPQLTTVVWSGNTDGSAANSQGNGLEASGPIWKQFMDFAHAEKERSSFARPNSIQGTGGFLYIKGKKPEEIEAIKVETIEVDGLCHGMVTEATPSAAIKKGIFLEIGMPIEAERETWSEPIMEWLETPEGREYLLEEFELTEDQVQFLESPENACERPNPGSLTMTTSLTDDLKLFAGLYPVEITYDSDHPVRFIEIYVNGAFYRKIEINDRTSGKVKGNFALARTDGNRQTVTIKAIDKFGYSDTKTYNLELLDRDTTPPVIQSDVESPLVVSYGGPVRISGTVQDINEIVSIEFYLDGELYGSVAEQDTYGISIDTVSELGFGDHELVIVGQDFQGNTAHKAITITVE